jgi:hypothetical protein
MYGRFATRCFPIFPCSVAGSSQPFAGSGDFLRGQRRALTPALAASWLLGVTNAKNDALRHAFCRP